MFMSRIVSRATLASLQGVSLPTIDAWVRAGCPVVTRGGRGKEWKFDTAQVTEWRIDRKVAEATGAEKADTEEPELAELDVARERAQVVSVEQLQRNLGNLFAEISINLRNIPGRVCASLVGLTDERRIKEIILGEIDQTLNALADSDVLIESSDDDEE
jgi:phage terminase Nu1 subunit (DNA packaging protein)